ncbi:MerR family transcriptional regulator [Spiractinospora alimapuensis]|uniref:MerR family transcriptional regulator n=1 Tax=Spiractinospora alimapuensis TaxID=2820884 RepID=UPI001F1592F1|nr:MerR family transcriptional regulator [Spiractinospora alimapuensis]QVQ50420.1 MerR family transcriptional regulator [Spiractinospora alimapuensis]
MYIGEVAKRAGVSARAVRHYEQAGLVTSTRAGNGYRVYPDGAVTRVANIAHLVSVGLTLADVREFLPCLDGDVAAAPPDPEKLALARTRLATLNDRIAAQIEVRDRLAAALDRTEAGETPRTP